MTWPYIATVGLTDDKQNLEQYLQHNVIHHHVRGHHSFPCQIWDSPTPPATHRECLTHGLIPKWVQIHLK